MLKKICLTLSFVFVFILTKILQFTQYTCTSDTQSRHIYGLYYLSTAGLVHLMSVLHNTHTETNVLLMCINYNGLILVCPHLITPIINQLNKQTRGSQEPV